jgi:hypothetical protein
VQRVLDGRKKIVPIATMPRSAILDAAGVLHHGMGRGIKKRKIFLDDQDRVDFINMGEGKSADFRGDRKTISAGMFPIP